MRAAVGRGARPCRAHTREELAERDLVWIDADELGQLEEAEERPEHALEHLLLAPAFLDRGELVEIADLRSTVSAHVHDMSCMSPALHMNTMLADRARRAARDRNSVSPACVALSLFVSPSSSTPDA